jgi:hypothetical protein
MMWSDQSRRGIAIAVLHGLAVRLAPAPQLGDEYSKLASLTRLCESEGGRREGPR